MATCFYRKMRLLTNWILQVTLQSGAVYIITNNLDLTHSYDTFRSHDKKSKSYSLGNTQVDKSKSLKKKLGRLDISIYSYVFNVKSEIKLVYSYQANSFIDNIFVSSFEPMVLSSFQYKKLNLADI